MECQSQDISNQNTCEEAATYSYCKGAEILNGHFSYTISSLTLTPKLAQAILYLSVNFSGSYKT